MDMPGEMKDLGARDAPMVIAGSGRSGTTWVLDVLATSFNLRPIFEPLNPYAVKEAEAYAGRYVPRGADIPGMDAFFEKIFAGDLYTSWTDLRFHPSSLLPERGNLADMDTYKLMLHRWAHALKQYRTYGPCRAREQIIVKFIRANLLLGWLSARFDAKILFLCRHPGAVAESKLRLGGDSWDPETMLGTYRRDNRIGDLRGGRYRDLLERNLTPTQALTLHWCIENQTPLEEATENGYLVVHYEDLVDNGDPIWDRIASYFGLTIERWDHKLLCRPSQQASDAWRSSAQSVMRSHQDWMNRISPTCLQEIDGILKETGEIHYSAEDPLPKNSHIAS